MAARLSGRAAALLALVGAVVAVHGCVVRHVGEHLAPLGGSDPLPERMQATYTRTMELADPVVAARTVPPPRRRPPRAVEAPRAASVPETVASAASEPVAESVPTEAIAEATPEVAPAAAASAPAVPSAVIDLTASGAGEAPPFEWPQATRVTFNLTGNFRGDVHGSAQVEWVRQDDRYQVHLDVVVGLQVAPLMTRRMSSEGRITPDGLRPDRYDQETKLAFSTPSRSTVLFGPADVLLANGQRRERWTGVQDTASQFVQLAWQFTTQPELLKPGAVIEVPLALPRAISRMRYNVSEPEVLWTDFGQIPVIRLTPQLVPKPGGDLAVEMWIAPQFRYLPIRLKIHQDAETFVDLMITKPPELGGG